MYPREASGEEPGETALLLEVALEFGRATSLDTLLQLVLARVTHFLDAERALFALFDRHHRLERAVVHNLDWPGPPAKLPVSCSVLERVLTSLEPQFIPDAAHDAEFRSYQSVRFHNIRFALAVPVPVDEAVTGVIYADSRARVQPDLRRRLKLLEALASLVSMAVANARLHDERRFRARFLSMVVHNLRAPLAVLQVNSDVLQVIARQEPPQDGPQEAPRAGLQQLSDEMASGVRRITHLIRDAQRLSEPSGREETAPVDVQAYLSEHLRGLATVACAQRIALRLAPSAALPAVETFPRRLDIVLDNLVLNAIKYAREGSEVELHVAAHEDPGPPDALARPFDDAALLFARVEPLVPAEGTSWVRVSITNEGPPIEAALHPTLFADNPPRERLQRGFVSSGLGLSIVHQCMRHLGGAVWLERSDEARTTFVFALPARLKDRPGDPEKAPEVQ
ncbi:MAG: GAF domain-containing sensor histidine kinase [Deltaproteobacteria bacterium]|nr:GAF domain-containing sensor histidine kinase [Deltaproteobacteria bacterium]